MSLITREKAEMFPVAVRRDSSRSPAVAPPGVEPGRHCWLGILNPLRLPFRQGAVVISEAMLGHCRAPE